MCTIISVGRWTVLALNLLGQARMTNQRMPESFHNDPPCRWWLQLFHKLIKDSKESILRITVQLIDGVDSGFRQFQHTSKFVRFRSHVKYIAHHVWNIILIQNSVFERVSVYKRKRKNSNAVALACWKILSAKTRGSNCMYIHFKRSFSSFYIEYRTCHVVSPS